jgi:hypothetical protein
MGTSASIRVDWHSDLGGWIDCSGKQVAGAAGVVPGEAIAEIFHDK